MFLSIAFQKKKKNLPLSLFKRLVLCYNIEKGKKRGEGMKAKLRHPLFWAFHGAAILGVLLFPLYVKITSYLGGIFGDCLMHRFFIYCPLCGGTRALAALLRFDLVTAWNCNAFVVILAFVAIGIDVWAWVRYFQKKEPLVILPNWTWIVFCASLVFYLILRNVLMIFFGIDPTGDLGFFWEAIRALKG